MTGSFHAWTHSESCVARTPTLLFQHPGSEPPGQPRKGCVADGQWEQLQLSRVPLPAPPLEWIWYRSESEQEARPRTDTFRWYDSFASLGSLGRFSKFRSLLTSEFTGDSQGSLKDAATSIYITWIAHCILALSFLGLAYRISVSLDRELFFNALLTSCSRLRSPYPVQLEIFFNLAACTPLESQRLQSKDTKCRISTSEENCVTSCFA